jgi:hypothetical protein
VIRPALAGLVLCLVALQYVTLADFAVLPPSLNFHSLADFLDAVRAHVPLDAWDAALALAVIALVAWIAAIERRDGALAAWLGDRLTAERPAQMLVVLAGAIAARGYLGAGAFTWAADAPQHIAYTDLVAHSLGAGASPWWTWYLGTGSPYLQMYGFLFFLLAGGVGAALPTEPALKLVMGLLHALSGLGLYHAARAAGLRRAAAVVGGLGYVLCFWHTQQVLVMGRYPLSLVYTLLPWVLWAVERSRGEDGWRSALLGGAVLGLVVLTHPGYGAWACVFVAAYVLLRHASAPAWQRHLLQTGLLLAVGLFVGGALVGPMWFDRQATGLAGGFSLPGVPDPTWQSLVVWSNHRFNLIPPDPQTYNWYGGYLGLSLLVLASLAVCRLRRRRAAGAAFGCLALALALALAYSSAVVQSLPGIHLLSGGRFLLFATLFLALAAAHGTQWLLACRRRAWRRALATLLLLLAVDLGSTTFQQPYGPHGGLGPERLEASAYDPLVEAAEAFEARGELPPNRVMLARGDLNFYLASGLTYARTRTPIPAGPHPGELVAVFDAVQPVERYLSWRAQQADAGAGLLDRPARSWLRLLNVTDLLVVTPQGNHNRLVSHPVEGATPVVAAAAVGSFDDFLATRPDLQTLLDTTRSDRVRQIVRALSWAEGMELDDAAPVARRIFARDPSQALQLGSTPQMHVDAHRVFHDRVELQVTLSAPAALRLAYGWWPHTQVLVNGDRADAFETADRFTALYLERGTHIVVLQPRLSTLRRLWLSLAAVVVFASAWLFCRAPPLPERHP